MGFEEIGLRFEDNCLGFEDIRLRFEDNCFGFEDIGPRFEDNALVFEDIGLRFEDIRLGFEDNDPVPRLGYARVVPLAPPPRDQGRFTHEARVRASWHRTTGC